MKQLVCPISKEKISEGTTRISAFIVFLLLLITLLFQLNIFTILVASDFFIRAFTRLKFSPITYTANHLSNKMWFSGRTVNKAPKVFAARLGFIMCCLIVLFLYGGFYTMANLFGGIPLLLTALEFGFGFCLGCVIYTYVVLPFYENT